MSARVCRRAGLLSLTHLRGSRLGGTRQGLFAWSLRSLLGANSRPVGSPGVDSGRRVKSRRELVRLRCLIGDPRFPINAVAHRDRWHGVGKPGAVTTLAGSRRLRGGTGVGIPSTGPRTERYVIPTRQSD